MWYITVGTIVIVFAVGAVCTFLTQLTPTQHAPSLVYQSKSMLIIYLWQWCIAYGILGWVPTIPIQAYWNLTLPATRYAFGSLEVETFVATYTSLTATNMILDMIILAIPAPLLLYNKTSSAKSRWALICLFSIGSL